MLHEKIAVMKRAAADGQHFHRGRGRPFSHGERRDYQHGLATFKAGKLAAEVEKPQPALGESRTDGGQRLALAEGFLWPQPPGNLA
jgi:hypothetical protein